MFVEGYDIVTAIGTTSLVVALTGISSSIAHVLRKNVRFDIVYRLWISAAIGLIIGLLTFDVATRHKKILDLALAMFLGVTVVKMSLDLVGRKTFLDKAFAMYKRFYGHIPSRVRSGTYHVMEFVNRVLPIHVGRRKFLIYVLGFNVGLIIGLTGLAGGYIIVPALIYLMHLSPKLAVGVSAVSYTPLSIVSAYAKAVKGYVSLDTAIAIGLGIVVGAQLGARLLEHLPERLVKILFCVLLTVVEIRLVLRLMS